MAEHPLYAELSEDAGLETVYPPLFSLIPDGLQLLRRIPKLILMVEFNGETEDEVRNKIKALHRDLKKYRARYEINGFEEDATEGKSEKFWVMRRQSFQLLRSKVKRQAHCNRSSMTLSSIHHI